MCPRSRSRSRQIFLFRIPGPSSSTSGFEKLFGSDPVPLSEIDDYGRLRSSTNELTQVCLTGYMRPLIQHSLCVYTGPHRVQFGPVPPRSPHSVPHAAPLSWWSLSSRSATLGDGDRRKTTSSLKEVET